MLLPARDGLEDSPMGKRKTSTTGYQRSRIYAYAQLLKYFRRDAEVAEHDYRNVFVNAKEVFEQNAERSIEGARILEVGCGHRYAVTLLFHSLGADVTGIDTDVVSPRLTPAVMLKVIKQNGLERLVKTIGRRLLFDRGYYRVISREAGVPLKFDMDLRCMSACELEFPDCSFDYVCSNAVFEHIDDPEKAVKELHRVLKPGGIANIEIHLYPSISGGHNLEWCDPDHNPSKTVSPWDHLRQSVHPTHVYLNKWRDGQYFDVLDRYFTILDARYQYEGRQLLTPEIAEELPDYTEDELLKRCVRYVLRKES